MRLRDFLHFLAGGMLAMATYRALIAYFPPPAPTVHPEPRVVRMLDVTIRDSNVSNVRQRFICEPAK